MWWERARAGQDSSRDEAERNLPGSAGADVVPSGFGASLPPPDSPTGFEPSVSEPPARALARGDAPEPSPGSEVAAAANEALIDWRTEAVARRFEVRRFLLAQGAQLDALDDHAQEVLERLL